MDAVSSCWTQEGQDAPTTMVETHAALLRLAAGHGAVHLDVGTWDYLDHDPPTRRIVWAASVFARGSADTIIAHVYSAVTPAQLLASIAAQLAAHAGEPPADVQALGEVPGVSP